jgi:ABC-type multidrug transport system fused ATPase/permease subunit
MKFFDTYSIGSIVSRLSNDTEAVDSELPWILKIFLGSFVNFIGSIVVLSY